MTVSSELDKHAALVVKQPRHASPAFRKLIIHLVLIGGALLLLPLAWMLFTSLKDLGAVLIIPPQWIPDEPRWSNYVEVFQVTPFAHFIANTAIITFLSVMGKVLSCSIVAYAFARMRWRGRNVVFLIMLATLMLPPQVTLIPQFVIYRELKWIDTFLPLILPHWFGGPFATFLLRQYFMTLPTELDDAARIDGASYFGIYWGLSCHSQNRHWWRSPSLHLTAHGMTFLGR